MKERGVTQTALAETFSVSQTAVWKWLKNTIPSGDKLSEVANHFGLSVDALLYGDDAPAARAERPDVVERKVASESDVEGMLRKLPPNIMAEITRRVHRDCLIECDVKLNESAFRRGWVEASLQYKTEGVPPGHPSKTRISRLETARATEALNVAVARNDPEAILIPSLPTSFLKAMPSKGDPLRMLTQFCTFALCRAAIRLSFGDAAAPKILRDLRLGYWLDLLEVGAGEK